MPKVGCGNQPLPTTSRGYRNMQTETRTTESLDWMRYRKTGDIAARNRLVQRHIPLVHHFAHRLRSRASAVEMEDVVGAGMVGLLSAVCAYDPDRGCRFSTYAATRIRGAILDEVRRRDIAPRSVRRRQRDMERAGDRLAVELDRRPREPELAGVLGVDARTLWRWKWDVARSQRVSLTDVLSPGLPSGECEELGRVEARLTLEAEVRRLRCELATLDERERVVVDLYDMQGLTLRDIAGRLGVSESRVSQIRTGALKRLRGRMQDLRDAA